MTSQKLKRELQRHPGLDPVSSYYQIVLGSALSRNDCNPAFCEFIIFDSIKRLLDNKPAFYNRRSKIA